jgi:hypothetical protein
MRHDAVDEAHRQRLRGAVAAAQVPDLARLLLADDAREIGRAEAGIDRADLGPDLAELGLLGGDGQVAERGQHVAAADGETLHAGDHGLGHVADQRLQFLDRQADGAAAVILAVMGADWSPPVQKDLSPAPPSTMTPMSRFQPARWKASISSSTVLPAEGVVAVGTVDGDEGDAVGALVVENVLVGRLDFAHHFVSCASRCYLSDRLVLPLASGDPGADCVTVVSTIGFRI